MTVSITLKTNHKGLGTTRVAGDEYVVDAVCNITSYTALGEVITASKLGLSSVHAVMLTGSEKPATYALAIELDTSGDYASGSSFQITATNLDGTNAATSATADVGTVRIRAYGLI